MGEVIGKLFGGGQKGPSQAEIAVQRDRYEKANRAEAEADQRTALAARATSLRRSLSDREKRGTLGG
jgi:hypothetical protein